MKAFPPLPYSTSTVHRPFEPLDPGAVDQLRQAVQTLLAEAATFDVNSPISALTRWRATALVIIQSLCTPGDIAWQVLRLEAPWSLTDTAEAGVREQELAEGWSITYGVLEGLLPLLPSMGEADLGPELIEPRELLPVGESDQSVDWARVSFPGPPGSVGLTLLGTPQVSGARGQVESNRTSRLTEYAIWLYLNPGTDRHAMDAALWPENTTRADSRNTAMSRLRAWLGVAHFPKWTQETGYILAPSVTSDWNQFCNLADFGERNDTPTGTRCLRAALQLVEGPPFADAIRPDWYAWATPYVQEMTETIVSAARELAHRYLKEGDLAGARWAIKRGYQALPGGLQQFRTAADGVTDPYSEADGLRHLADQLKHTPAPAP